MRHVFFAALLIAASLALPSATAKAAGGAYVVDDSEADKPGECQVESWVSFANNRDFTAVVSPGCGVKFPIPLEFDATLQRSRSGGAWSNIGALTAKTTFVSTDDRMIGIGLEGTLDAIDGSGVGGAIFMPLTIKLGKDWKINLNGGWLYDAADKLNYATWGAGFEWTFLKPFTLIGEVYGQAGRLPAVGEDDPPTPTSIRAPRTQIGLRYAPKKNVEFDVIWGHNITGENAHWLTLGVNLHF